MEAGGDALENDPLIAQLCEELPDLANAREATAAFTFDPSAQYNAPAPPGGVMPGHVNVMQLPGFLPLPVPPVACLASRRCCQTTGRRFRT